MPDNQKCDLCGRESSKDNPLAPFHVESNNGIFEQMICLSCRETKPRQQTWRDGLDDKGDTS